MSTCNQVITRALSKLGVLGEGQSPSPSQLSLGLDTMTALYRRWTVEGSFGELRDSRVTAPYTTGENERILRASNDVTSITLPETVPDETHLVSDYGEFTSGGSTRLPRDGAVVTITDGPTASRTDPATLDYVYDGSVKQWLNIAGLTSTDYAPLSFRDTLGLASCLAVELADDYGQAVGQATVKAAERFQLALSTDYSFGEDVTKVTWF